MTNEPQHSRKKILTFCRILVFKVMLLVLPLHGCDYCVDMLGSGLCIYAFDAKGNKVTIDKISVIRNNRKTDHKSPPEDFSWQNLGTKEKHLRCLTDANPEGHYTVFVWRKHYLLAKDVYLGKDSSGCGLDFKKMVFRFPE